MAKLGEIVHKKVLGIPVVYLFVGAAIVFAYFAWKLKPTSTADSVATGDESTTPGNVPDRTADDSLYTGLGTNGTVIAVNPSAASETVAADKTNSDWLKDGVSLLVTEGRASGTQANAALNKFLNGQDRSFEENEWIDFVIKKKGLPPDGVDPSGKIGPKPVRKNGEPPTTHTVTGPDDNEFWNLAWLYYGKSNQDTLDLLQSANIGFHNGPWPVGTKIHVPKYTDPVYYTVKGTVNTAAKIAAANGISVQQLDVLNNGKIKFPAKVGTKVRVK